MGGIDRHLQRRSLLGKRRGSLHHGRCPSRRRRQFSALSPGVEAGQLPARSDCDRLSAFFWIGWEGAVLRARLARSTRPLDIFIDGFLACAATDHTDRSLTRPTD
ncbi:TetR family transcriptional regulator C-terminal domain-containing protein [Nocardioides sp. NPDC047086]|uniref:TetR family transcriptional regulator C-terminal domain-containing protein n=1 Tax=Nocardioides sp. NPDC047086 TaxID=3154810 RepID=UPI0033D10CA0